MSAAVSTPAGNSREVAVLIVTHNCGADLDPCFASLAQFEGGVPAVIVVDCASHDGSAAAARAAGHAHGVATTVVPLSDNRGFAGGMNEALRHTHAPFVLSLNADARPEPGFLTTLLQRLREHPRAAAATGRLIRFQDEGTPAPPILDACGMRLTLTWRHFDRGSGQTDRGQFSETQQVFGGTGAATLFRRASLDDVAIDGEIFATAFHSFREDAELAFRFAERGWQVLYEPKALAFHRRHNLPARRSQMPPHVNFHSLKNRYLLRAYHQTPSNFLLTLLPTLARDLAALAYVLLQERSSLAAYRWLWNHRQEIRQTRRIIQSQRTRPASELNRWFLNDSLPL